jgi:hypothetical protein
MPETITVAEAGRRGGQARARNLSPERRREIATKATEARWAKVRAQVEESRRAQDMSPTVTDDQVLGQLAAKVGDSDG